jgi:hypothetical protein
MKVLVPWISLLLDDREERRRRFDIAPDREITMMYIWCHEGVGALDFTSFR